MHTLLNRKIEQKEVFLVSRLLSIFIKCYVRNQNYTDWISILGLFRDNDITSVPTSDLMCQSVISVGEN